MVQMLSALQNLIVLDLTRLLPGPAATDLLAQFGADVIKVEEPGSGDFVRANPEMFETVNRGKRSVAINLKHARGRDLFLRLATKADVVIEGFRPGVMERLGVGWSTLQPLNRRLVYCALTGYGQDSPYRNLAGHDVNYLAMAGVLDLIGPADGPPAIPGVQIADLSGGSQQAVIGILLALAARERSGCGQFVDVAMLDGSAALLPIPLSEFKASGKPVRRGRHVLSGSYACYNVYGARDGRYLAVGALEAKFWSALCTAIGKAHLIAAQFAPEPRATEIRDEIAAVFLERDAEEWFRFFAGVDGGVDACVTPVRTVQESLADDHFRKRPMGVTPLLSDTPPRVEGRAPRLGEHTREVLAAAGYGEEELDELARDGAIATDEPGG
jgi:crotonobetainyl-CoA:carnitine CoA-transferase CaiB-like acyl-CoA transferase